MPRKTRNEKPLSAEALVKLGAAVAKGTSRRKILKANPGLPARLVRELQKCGASAEEYRALLTAELRDAAREALASFREDLRTGRVPAASKIIAVGVFCDKETALAARGAIQSLDVSFQINNFGPQSREEVIARLRGETFDLPSAGAGASSPVLPRSGHNAEPIES